jgi:predicted mannosyl-3-phosphoglycerate phosphatase (HAD superfamily)
LFVPFRCTIPLQFFFYPRGVTLRSSNKLIYVAIDNLVSSSGRAVTGFPEFLTALEEAHLPCVWVSSRNRHELDATLRKLGHASPFIAEGGSGVYLPEDYFHLKPARTIRFARFTVIPVATPQPAAAEALAQLGEDTGIEVVLIRALSPRELSQNVGMPQREAELLRQRDFDEYFFYAGASDTEIKKFQAEASRRNLGLRPRGNLWSLVVGASLASCVRQLTALYERALRTQPFTMGIATLEEAAELFPCCNRAILLANRASPDWDSGSRPAPLSLPLFAPDTWQITLDAILAKRP